MLFVCETLIFVTGVVVVAYILYYSRLVELVFFKGSLLVRSLWSGPKYNVYFLIWCGCFRHCNFRNSPRICQQTHPMCATPCVQRSLNHWTKRSGAVESVKEKKRGKVLVKVNHRYPAWKTLICGPVELLLPHPDAECVKCIGIDIPSPLCSMLTHDSFSTYGPTMCC